MSRRTSFGKRRSSRISTFAGVGLFLVFSLFVTLSLWHTLPSTVLSQQTLKKIVYALQGIEFVDSQSGTLAHDLQQTWPQGEFIATDLSTSLTKPSAESVNSINAFLRNEKNFVSVTMLKAPVYEVFETTPYVNKTMHTQMMLALPGDTLLLGGDRLRRPTEWGMKCIGSSPSERERDVKLVIESQDDKELLSTVMNTKGKRVVRKLSALTNPNIVIHWPADAPCLLGIDAVSPDSAENIPGTLLVTIDELSDSKYSLEETTALLRRYYGSEHVVTLNEVWPQSTLLDQNLASLFGGTRPPRAILGASEELPIRTLEVRIGSEDLCRSPLCGDAKSVFSIQNVSQFSKKIVAMRSKNIRAFLKPYLSERIDWKNSFVHIDLRLPEKNVELTWGSALKSRKPLGKWIVAGMLEKLGFRGWRIPEFRTEEKEHQIDDSLAAAFEQLIGGGLPNVVILIHQLSHSEGTTQYTPLAPGKLLLALPHTKLLGETDTANLLTQNLVGDVLGALYGGGRESSVTLKPKSLAEVRTQHEEAFLFRSSQQPNLKWILFPTQTHPDEETTALSSNLGFDELREKIDLIKKIDSSNKTQRVFFKFISAHGPEELSFALSSTRHFVQCYSNQEEREKKTIHTAESTSLSVDLWLRQELPYVLACDLGGTTSDKDSLVMKIERNKNNEPLNQIGFGQFAQTWPNQQEGDYITLDRRTMDMLLLAGLFPREELFPSIKTFIWSPIFYSDASELGSGFHPLLSVEDLENNKENLK